MVGSAAAEEPVQAKTLAMGDPINFNEDFDLGKLLPQFSSSVSPHGKFYRWSYPAEHADLVVANGSIAVDGVSLTIVDPEPGSFAAALSPETLRRTNLGAARVGGAVNLEFDMIAKYVRTLVQPYLPK